MRVYLGPWVFSSRQQSYVAPDGARPLLDLSPNSAQGSCGLFAADALPLDWRLIDDPTGHAWYMLTTGAGLDDGAVLPLAPTFKGVLELHLGELGCVRSERFTWGRHPHTNRLRDLLRGHFRERWHHDTDHARRALDWERHKYGLTAERDWRELVPSELLPHVEGPLPQGTTISDDFNRADVADLDGNTATFGGVGQGWTWANYQKFSVTSNQAQLEDTGATQASARAQSDLSGSDHYAQMTAVNPGTGDTDAGIGVAARFATSAQTHYASGPYNDGSAYLRKLISGTSTNLKTISVTQANPETWKLECSGSTIKSYQAGVLRDTTTDSAIAGNMRCGLWGIRSGGTTKPQYDNFTAADLGGATGRLFRTADLAGLGCGGPFYANPLGG